MEAQQYGVKISVGIRDAAGEELVRRAFLQLRGANPLAAKLTVDTPLADPAAVSAPSKEQDACEDEDTLKPVIETPVPEPTAVIADVLRVDLDPATLGVQESRTIPSGAKVEIALIAENITAAYAGYQWQLEWDDAAIDFGGAVENTAGHGLASCSAATSVNDASLGVPEGKEWVGQGAGCVTFSGATKFSGLLVTISAQCVSEGTTDVRLVTLAEDESFGTMLTSDTGAPMKTTVGPAVSLRCDGAADQR